MSKKTNSSPASEEKAKEASAAEQNEQTAAQAKPEAEAAKQPEEKKPEAAKQQEASEFEKAQQALAQEHDSYLRLAAEYDNYRKRSQKEKDSLYTEIRSETVEKFLPVYDNLERALAQETQDAAFKKGVEKARNLMIVMWLALFGGFYLLAKLVPTAAMARTLTERLDSIPAGYAAVLGSIGGVVLVAAALWGSYRLSCKIYAQKEF